MSEVGELGEPAGDVSRIVIIGSGQAGATAAVSLREQGFAGTIELLGVEAHNPYERPPLSKGILLGDADEPDWVKPADYYAAHGINRVAPSLVTEIRRADHLVVTGNSQHAYDKLLLATGAAPRTVTIPGNELRQILTLRNLEDSLMIRDALRLGGKVAIVGAGWIGCEVAAAARKHGDSVTLIEPAAQPLLRVLGAELGQVFADLQRDNGVDVRLGVGVTAFEHDGDSHLSGVRLSDESFVEADVVVLAVGVSPRTELAERAGLVLAEGGVAVDENLCTSDPDIYAVGDIAAHDHPRLSGRVRVEHWANAKDQGAHVAQNLLGASVPYSKLPYFFSDQYDLGLEYRGHADPETDELVVLGDVRSREFTAVWLRDDVVVAAMNVNQWDRGEALEQLVDSQAKVSADARSTGRFF